jgi:hypothetical protein
MTMMTQTDPPYPRSSGHAGDPLPDRQQDRSERATEVAHDAADEARSVAHTAQHEAGRVADEVRDQVANLTESAREQLHDQARIQTDHLGEAIGNLGERIQALADGRPEEAGQAQELARNIAGQVKDVSGRIETLGFDGAVDALQRYARRRPGAFLAGAAAVGFAAARLTQGATSASDAGSGSTGSRPSTRPSGQQSGLGDEGDTARPLPSSIDTDRRPLEGSDPIVLPELERRRR